MNCNRCLSPVDERSIVVTLVQDNTTYAAVLHPRCLRLVIGAPQARRLESLAFLSGWRQLGLPEFREDHV